MGNCRVWTLCWLAQLLVLLPAQAEPRHGLSAFGELKYGARFKHFDYVNPDAPKGGRLSLIGPGARITFDSFNPFILKGDAAQGLELLYDSLMVRAADEPDSVYGLVARSAEVAPDKRSVTFQLRPEARFSDGSQITADDVVFTFTTLKEKGHPRYRFSLRDVIKVEAIDRASVRFTFQGVQLRDLPLIVATLPVLPKAAYATRTFEVTSLEPPVSSGPYKIGAFQQGLSVTYKRRPDYWATDLPVVRGRFNFDEVRYEYFRDRTAQLESLKAGNYDFREEFTAKDWATAYDIPQIRDGRMVRLTLPDESPSGAQGFFLNTRRDKLADPRVRKALNYAFDYEWTNRNLFYGLYARTHSYFENSELKAEGVPSPQELALLEPLRGNLAGEVFGEAYRAPKTDGAWGDRANLREAQRLLHEAGWRLDDPAKTEAACGLFCRTFSAVAAGRGSANVRNEKGEPLEIELLIYDPSSERFMTPYVRNLRSIGVIASIRRVDPAQYERRVKSFDFDVITARFSMPLTPGVEIKNFFGSEAAATDGSYNLAGIKDPAVDALLGHVLEAKSRADLITATRALDRVLRSGHYWIPHWFKASHNIVHWDKFGRPPVKPKYDRGVVDTWWYDAEKAARLNAN